MSNLRKSILFLFLLVFGKSIFAQENQMNSEEMLHANDVYTFFGGANFGLAKCDFQNFVQGVEWKHNVGYTAGVDLGSGMLMMNRVGFEASAGYETTKYFFVSESALFNTGYSCLRGGAKMKVNLFRNYVEHAMFIKLGGEYQFLFNTQPGYSGADIQYSIDIPGQSLVTGLFEIGGQVRGNNVFMDLSLTYRTGFEDLATVRMLDATAQGSGVEYSAIGRASFFGATLRFHKIYKTKTRDNIEAPLLPKKNI